MRLQHILSSLTVNYSKGYIFPLTTVEVKTATFVPKLSGPQLERICFFQRSHMVKSCLFSDMETNTFITFDNSFFLLQPQRLGSKWRELGWLATPCRGDTVSMCLEWGFRGGSVGMSLTAVGSVCIDRAYV